MGWKLTDVPDGLAAINGPVGVTEGGSVEHFQRRRQTLLLHQRINVLAAIGYVTPEISTCVYA